MNVAINLRVQPRKCLLGGDVGNSPFRSVTNRANVLSPAMLANALAPANLAFAPLSSMLAKALAPAILATAPHPSMLANAAAPTILA